MKENLVNAVYRSELAPPSVCMFQGSARVWKHEGSSRVFIYARAYVSFMRDEVIAQFKNKNAFKLSNERQPDIAKSNYTISQ